MKSSRFRSVNGSSNNPRVNAPLRFLNNCHAHAIVEGNRTHCRFHPKTRDVSAMDMKYRRGGEITQLLCNRFFRPTFSPVPVLCFLTHAVSPTPVRKIDGSVPWFYAHGDVSRTPACFKQNVMFQSYLFLLCLLPRSLESLPRCICR